MTELKATVETTYALSGLTFKDIEVLCLGLDELGDCENSIDIINRKRKLTKVMEDVLPDIGEIIT